MRQFNFPVRWTFLFPYVLIALLLGLVACGVSKRLAEVNNNIELRQAMEEAGKERIAWRMAKKLNTFDSYRNFLLLFPEGEYAAGARDRLQAYEAALWEEVRWATDNEKRISDYLLVKYLDLYPQGPHAAEAREQYRKLSKSSLWYTAALNAYDAYEILRPRESGVVHIDRLSGLTAYLNHFPQGVLKELMMERLARTYIGYEVLPEWGQSVEEEMPLDAETVEVWASALSSGSELNGEAAARASAYLRSALQDRSRLNTLDADHNSIPDEIEMPELIEMERPSIDYVLPEAPPAGRPGEEKEPTSPDDTKTKPDEGPPDKVLPEEFPETIPPETETKEAPEETDREEVDMALSLEDMAERTAESISQGQFLYDSIPTLVVDEPFFFQLMIISSTDPVPGGVRRGRVSPRRIPITSEMAVNIQPADPGAFTINSLSASHQPVFPGDTTVWSWNVIPRKPGTHQVAITIDIITTGPTSGEPLKKNITVFNEKVEVKTIEKPAAPVADDTNDEEDISFGFYPWLLLLLPIAALGFFLVNRRRKEDTAAVSDQPFGKETPEQRNFLLSNKKAILELLNKSEKAIAKGDTRQAIEELEAFFNDRHYAIHQQLVTLAAQLNKYQREFNLGLKPDDSIPNRVNMALLDLINRIHEVVEE